MGVFRVEFLISVVGKVGVVFGFEGFVGGLVLEVDICRSRDDFEWVFNRIIYDSKVKV